MKSNRNNQDNGYLIMDGDGFMDISSGTPHSDQDGYVDDYEPARGNGSSKKPVVIAVVSVVAAAAIGVGGFFAYRYFSQKAAGEETPSVFTYAANSVVSGIDISGKTMEQAKKLLEQNTDKFITPVTLEIDVNGEKSELRENNFTYTFNIDEVLNKMKSDIENSTAPTGDQPADYSVAATVTDDSIKSNVDKICEERNSEPKNARVAQFHPYESKRFDFAEAEDGITVNADDLSAQIKESFAKGNAISKISADVEKKKADMSASALEDKLVKLASYETYSTNTENGTTNMRVSLDSCNGSIIEPGATWSFNECTGDSNLASNGYKSASVISEGKLIEGIGGGICQSSSTIYNAAVRANMKIVERYNHKWASSYVPTGLDATIDYPNLDLKLGNPTDCQMFIECKVVGSTLYCSIWGEKPTGYDEIRTHNELGDSGEKSYSVRAWRIYYKDGKEIDREELPKSSYDNDYGVVFSQSDNDPQATSTNVDGVSDGTVVRHSDDSDSGSYSYNNNNSQSSNNNDDSSQSQQSESQSEAQSSEESFESVDVPSDGGSGSGGSGEAEGGEEAGE